MAWISNKQKETAKQVDLVKYLQCRRPDLISERKPGDYVYAKNFGMTFFKGKDGFYHYCDYKKKKSGKEKYSGDNISFLIDVVGGYTYQTAVEELLSFDPEECPFN